MPKTPGLRGLRERAALSQQELSDRSGVGRATIAGLESGRRTAQPRTVRRLAETLNTEPAELYREHDDPKAEASHPQPPLFNGGTEEERRVIESLKDHLDRLETALDRGDLDKVGLTVHRYIIALVGPMVEGPMRENPQEAERFVRLGRRVLDESRRLGVEDGTETAVVFDLARYRRAG